MDFISSEAAFSDCDDFDSLIEAAPSLPDNAAVALDLARRGFAVFPKHYRRTTRKWTGDPGYLQQASSDPDIVAAWWRKTPDAQVGLLCGERNGITVLDLDVKGGKDGVAALAAAGLPDLAALSPVRVRSPSGGWHLFFKYEPLVRNWVNIDPEGKQQPGAVKSGIDVRTQGGHVGAPGSSKGTRGQYVSVAAALGSVEVPAFPETLIPPLREVTPPPQILAVTSHMIDRSAEYLARSFAEPLNAMTADSGRNDALNKAAFWAGGAAAHGLITREKAEALLRAAAEKSGMGAREIRTTFASGFDAGLANPISNIPGFQPTIDDSGLDDLEDLPASSADDSFDSLLSASPEPEINPVTARLNKRHAMVVVRGRTLITTERAGGEVDFGIVRDLHAYYENDRVRTPDGKTEPASRRWMRSKDRRTFPDGVTFAPAGCALGTLNLWRGWAVGPDPDGSCQLFLDHVRTVVCRGNEEHAAYVVGWLAHMVQRPEEKPGVALVLRGAKGAGKDTIAEYVARMIGRRHAPTVAESDHIVGKFNARLENALLLHVQEGSWAGDRKAEGVLKYLVTSDRIEIERKGIDSINLPSVLRLFISANAEWVVPASADERRWAVFEVSQARRGDDRYFAALRAEMDGSGPAALLHYLRSYDLSRFNVRGAPETEGLTNQKIASLRDVQRWWHEILCRGMLGSTSIDDDGSWQEPQTVSRDALRSRYGEWAQSQRFRADPLDYRQFGIRLHEMVPTLDDRRLGGRENRSWSYVLPSLADCRVAFEAWIGGAVDWEAGG